MRQERSAAASPTWTPDERQEGRERIRGRPGPGGERRVCSLRRVAGAVRLLPRPVNFAPGRVAGAVPSSRVHVKITNDRTGWLRRWRSRRRKWTRTSAPVSSQSRPQEMPMRGSGARAFAMRSALRSADGSMAPILRSVSRPAAAARWIRPSRKGAVAWAVRQRPFPFPAHQTGRADFRIRLSDRLHRKAHSDALLRVRLRRSTPSSPWITAQEIASAPSTQVVPLRRKSRTRSGHARRQPGKPYTRSVAEVCRPAAQKTVQPIADLQPRRFVAGYQYVADLCLDPLDALLGRAAPRYLWPFFQ